MATRRLLPWFYLVNKIHTLSFFGTDVCNACGHIIASHEYTFSVVDDFQVQ